MHDDLVRRQSEAKSLIGVVLADDLEDTLVSAVAGRQDDHPGCDNGVFDDQIVDSIRISIVRVRFDKKCSTEGEIENLVVVHSRSLLGRMVVEAVQFLFCVVFSGNRISTSAISSLRFSESQDED